MINARKEVIKLTTGEKIRQLRKQLGMTQEELGNLIGVQKAAINKYETGVVVNLKQSVIASLAEALHVSPVELLSPEDNPPDQPLTKESRIISGGIDRMPPEKREQALKILQIAFAEYSDFFKEDHNDDA